MKPVWSICVALLVPTLVAKEFQGQEIGLVARARRLWESLWQEAWLVALEVEPVEHYKKPRLVRN